MIWKKSFLNLTVSILKYKKITTIEKDFFSTETINSYFYKTGESSFLTERNHLLDTVRKELFDLAQEESHQNNPLIAQEITLNQRQTKRISNKF